MEKVRRVATPTTRITNKVPRVPKRANFFARARFGDLGSKSASEIRRFVSKFPLARGLDALAVSQRPLQYGPVNLKKAPLPEDLQELTNHIKSLCYFLDSDMVGICEAPEYVWYSHDADGKAIEPRHPYALVLLIDQGYETMAGSSGDDWISASQSYRAYLKGSTIACTVAAYIRELGYDARAHTDQDSEVLHLPLAVLAGLGELSRIGEVVINPFLGPRFKTSVVTTNLPLIVDQPIDFGLQSFCATCMKCARECPCSAISFGEKVMFNGYEMWKPNVEACARYRINNPGGSSCGRCVKVCPYNKPPLWHHRMALWLTMFVPASHGLLLWLENRLEYGKREKEWKWWLDLEYHDGGLVKAVKTNHRNLRPGRKPPRRQVIPLYTADLNPPPDAQDAIPLDHKAAKSR
jgi:reductive dehalogenase